MYDDEPQESDLDVEVTVEYTNWFLYSYMYFSYQAQTSRQYVNGCFECQNQWFMVHVMHGVPWSSQKSGYATAFYGI